MPFGANSGTILSLSFFRQPYEENDSQPDQLTLVVDQLLLSERRLNVIDATSETNPIVILTDNLSSTC
jgi:hypothetical protein